MSNPQADQPAARPSCSVAVLGALAQMTVGTPGQITGYLAGQGITFSNPARVSQRLSLLASHDPPLVELVARVVGAGSPGVWRLTEAGRAARASRSGRLART